jgi:[acyl-carrier-protein] S-malonyltransferase
VEAKARGAKRVIALKVSAPFHCALMAPAQARLEPELRALTVQAPRVPVIANIDGQPRRDGASSIDALVAQVSGAVRWEDVIGYLVSAGVRAYVEVGPGTVLAGLVRKIDREAQVVSFGAPEQLAAVEALFAAS